MKKMVFVGLGLIGGSMAAAARGFEKFEIIGVDVSEPTLRYAAEHGVADRVTADAGVIREADVTFLCLHPQGIVRFLEEHKDDFKPGSLVSDVCGIKTAIVDAAGCLPDEVDFIGCHPMAGKETSGVENSEATLFQKAHFIITPRESSTPEHIALMERLSVHCGFRDVVNTTTENHDAIIAYTSQVMHIMAVAVCDDPDLFACRGFEGGSFRDCTRVAALDVPLWTELFSMNAPALIKVIRNLEDNLHAYRTVLESGDTAALSEKLAWSAARKRKMNLE